MKTTYALSARSKISLWLIFSVPFFSFVVLLATSGSDVRSIVTAIVVLLIACSLVPILVTFVYVTIDEESLTVPMIAILRRTIPIRSIRKLQYRPHGMGFLQGVTIEYVDSHGESRYAILPSLSAFGKAKTSQMIDDLTRINPAIKVDERITGLLSSGSHRS